MIRPLRIRDVARGIAVILLGALVSACPAPDVRQGQSGPVAWEVLDRTKTQFGWTFTILLREASGIGIQFETVQLAFALPPESRGMAWYGGSSERALTRRLEPHGELRETFTAPFFIDPPERADVEFRGKDDTGQPIRVSVRVYLR
jgi:hypothetical protein